MPDVEQAAETARFWVSFGQAAGLVGVTAAATAIGAAIASKAIDNVDAAALEDMGASSSSSSNQRRKRLTLEQAEQLQQQQQQQQETDGKE